MAAGYLPTPGKKVKGVEIGPCVADCQHRDCVETRTMAATLCRICGNAIGYETAFFKENDAGTPLVLTHAACAYKEVEADRAAQARGQDASLTVVSLAGLAELEGLVAAGENLAQRQHDLRRYEAAPLCACGRGGKAVFGEGICGTCFRERHPADPDFPF